MCRKINTQRSAETELLGASNFMLQDLSTLYILSIQGYIVKEDILHHDFQRNIFLRLMITSQGGDLRATLLSTASSFLTLLQLLKWALDTVPLKTRRGASSESRFMELSSESLDAEFSNSIWTTSRICANQDPSHGCVENIHLGEKPLIQEARGRSFSYGTLALLCSPLPLAEHERASPFSFRLLC